jgi:predicted nucleic acid-binding protein
MYVVDASVVVKWVIPGEPYAVSALKLKRDHLSGIAHLFAPSFMLHEVANSLWKAVRQGRITQKDACEALETLDNLNVSFHELNWSDISKVLNIAIKTNLTVYDAAYLYVSEKMNAQVITADDTMYQKGKEQFQVLHLKDYP